MIFLEGDWENIVCVMMGLFEKCIVFYLFFDLGYSVYFNCDLGLLRKIIMWRLEENVRLSLVREYLESV